MKALTPALAYTGLVTIAAILVYCWTMTQVGKMRGRHQIKAPAMTGHPDFERAVRVHENTLEQLVPFLAALWLCAVFWYGLAASVIGLIWVLARVHYAIAYYQSAEKRGPGFMVSFVCLLLLLCGALYGIVRMLIAMS